MSINTLDLHFNFLSSRDRSFSDLLEFMSLIDEEIEAFDFYNNHLDRLSEEQLTSLISQIPSHIWSLSFNTNHLGMKLKTVIANLPIHIRHLDLSHNQWMALSPLEVHEIMEKIPAHVTSLCLDYQDISVYCSRFPANLRILSISRRDDLKCNYHARKSFAEYFGPELRIVYLDEAVWSYAAVGELTWQSIMPMHHHFIYHAPELDLASVMVQMAALPENIQSLDLDLSYPVLEMFYYLSHEEKLSLIAHLPKSITRLELNSLVHIEIHKGTVNIDYSIEFQHHIFQKKFVSNPRFFALGDDDFESVGLSLSPTNG